MTEEGGAPRNSVSNALQWDVWPIVGSEQCYRTPAFRASRKNGATRVPIVSIVTNLPLRHFIDGSYEKPSSRCCFRARCVHLARPSAPGAIRRARHPTLRCEEVRGSERSSSPARPGRRQGRFLSRPHRDGKRRWRQSSGVVRGRGKEESEERRLL